MIFGRDRKIPNLIEFIIMATHTMKEIALKNRTERGVSSGLPIIFIKIELDMREISFILVAPFPEA